jgi:acyl carrier protein
MEKEQFLNAFQAALELKHELKMEDVFRGYPTWDSLSYMSLIAMLDSEYNLQIENATFEKMKTLHDVFDYVQLNTK